MVQSGLFYSGDGDMVECFSCQVKLDSWQGVDVADIEHLTHSPFCNFMKKKLKENPSLLVELVIILLQDRIATKRELEWVKSWITTPVLGCGDMDSASFNTQSSLGEDEEYKEWDEIEYITDTSSSSSYIITDL